MQREKSTDGQDILILFALPYVILERNLVPDSQLEIQIKETPRVASPGAEEQAFFISGLSSVGKLGRKAWKA